MRMPKYLLSSMICGALVLAVAAWTLVMLAPKLSFAGHQSLAEHQPQAIVAHTLDVVLLLLDQYMMCVLGIGQDKGRHGP